MLFLSSYFYIDGINNSILPVIRRSSVESNSHEVQAEVNIVVDQYQVINAKNCSYLKGTLYTYV